MNTIQISRDPGSYRDPSGHVYHFQGRILRTVTQEAATQYEAVRDNNAYNRLRESGAIVSSQELDDTERGNLPEFFANYSYILEHQKILYISYPYEWCFSQLRAAALHHLELQIEAFAGGLVCSDASAYNIQFTGGKPIFIDTLSLRPYREGEYWHGYTQFCRQFLYPLLLQAKGGLTFNSIYRGNMEGITAIELNTILPWYKKLSFNMLAHVSGVAAIEARHNNAATARKMHSKTLKPAAYLGFLTSLRDWIANLKVKTGHSIWDNYEQTQTYNTEEMEHKRKFIAEFVQATRPGLLYDLGCNTGSYSMLASREGAEYVIGYDYDASSVDIAYNRTCGGVSVLPLIMDAANPTPAMGWFQAERASFGERASADAFIALAFAHHLCIAKNIPMDSLVDWLASIATRGVLEFVPKEDPTVQIMLAMRDDIFHDYGKDSFEKELLRNFSIHSSTVISKSGRTLYWLERREQPKTC